MDRPRLLIVDDDDYTRQGLRILFARQGWDVILAATIAEGLARLDDDPRCIILDLNLPDGGGEVILREARGRLPRTMIAVCSGSVDLDQLAQVRGLQPELLLCKPIDLAPLDRMCRSALAG